MKRDKLLTIRIDEEKRKAFNSWCKEQNYSCSKFLSDIIEACLDNRIDKSILTEISVSSQSRDIKRQQQLDKLLDKLEQISQRVSKLERFAFSTPETAKKTTREPPHSTSNRLNLATQLVDQKSEPPSSTSSQLKEDLRQRAIDILWANK
jgi:hypothetical protein